MSLTINQGANRFAEDISGVVYTILGETALLKMSDIPDCFLQKLIIY